MNIKNAIGRYLLRKIRPYYFIDLATGERNQIITGLTQGQEVVHLFEGKPIKAQFIRYADYGFSCILKEIGTGKEYVALGNEVYFT